MTARNSVYIIIKKPMRTTIAPEDRIENRRAEYMRVYQLTYRMEHAEEASQRYREYRMLNPEAVEAYRVKWRADNIDYIRESQNRKVQCPCGGKYTISNKATHCKSKRHEKCPREELVYI